MIETGMVDSDGKAICIGSKVRIPTMDEDSPHGTWCEYTIEQKGMIPFVVYHHSAEGQIFPKGGVSCPLTNFYVAKEISRSPDLSDCLPMDTINIVS